MQRNIRLLLSYDGTDFHGWQRQHGVRTVQEVLEESLRRVLRHPVNVTASGRTDAGVHAAGQAANIETTCSIPASKLRHAIGSRLPKDMTIRAAADVSPHFHATRSAVSKLYRYRIHNARRRPVERMTQRYADHYWKPLDADRMREAAGHFIGEMDYSAMAGAGCVRTTMVRRVLRCDVFRHFDEIRIDVEGTGFLYNQVRNMVGTLTEVGRGHWPPRQVAEILAARDRTQAGPTAPAKGLCLQWVRYPSELLRSYSRVSDSDDDPSALLGW